MNYQQFEAYLAKGFTNEAIISILSPYIRPERQQKIDAVLDARVPSVTVALEQPSDIHNALAVVRTAEAFGVDELHLIAPEGNARSGWNTSKGAMNWVRVHYHAGLCDLGPALKQRCFVLAGAAMEGSQPLDTLPKDRPLCLILGNEHRGLSEEARSACDVLYHIPMVGMSESLNLSVAAGISLASVTAGRRRGYSEDERAKRRAWYFIRANPDRLV
ncbi:MAG: RNA methyltransferase, partial [Chlamydiia bacterium]|nr:RNA methyltransferase [Chlamydiia bacterium]